MTDSTSASKCVIGFGFLPTVHKGWLSIIFAIFLSRAEISPVIRFILAAEMISVMDKE
jgi:hypothetical protein